MSTSDGAQAQQSSDDPVLSGALAEMSAEGFQPDAVLSDLGTADTGASQPATDASAAPAAAPEATTGDDGTQSKQQPAADASTGQPRAGQPAADPLAGSEPYVVNGKTIEGVYRFPGEGLMIPADREQAFAQIVERAELAEALDRSSRDLSTANATYERLSAWKTTDANGQETTLTGLQGLEARFVNDARKDAAIAILDGILEDPSKLLSLLTQDQAGKVTVDPGAMETLAMRIQLAANDAEKATRASFVQLSGPPASAPSPTSGTPDYAASAPKLIAQSVGSDASLLTPEDRALLATQLSRYVREVSDEDRRLNPTLKAGGKIVDASYGQLVQHMVAQRKAAQATAKAAEKAGAVNAGMERGRQPQKQPPKPAAPAAPQSKSAERKRADWDGPLAQALEEMAIPR